MMGEVMCVIGALAFAAASRWLWKEARRWEQDADSFKGDRY